MQSMSVIAEPADLGVPAQRQGGVRGAIPLVVLLEGIDADIVAGLAGAIG